MSEKGSESVLTTVVPGLLKHLEYDIEVLEGDDASLLSASKLVINLEHKQNRLEFMKHKKILSTIPISDIEQLIHHIRYSRQIRKTKGFCYWYQIICFARLTK